MFLRCKVRRKDGKRHRYWSVVENTRIAGGRVVQRHVLYLGEINDSQELAWRRSIEVLEDGAARPRTLSLFPEDRVEGLLADASIVGVRLSELRLRRPRQWGACWLERFHFIEVSRVVLVGHCVRRTRTELSAVLQHERGDLSPYLEGDEPESRRALVLARWAFLRAVGVQKWSNGTVLGSPGEKRRRCGLSHGDTLRLGGSIREGGKGRSVGGFDARNARIDARLGDERKLARELTEERHQNVACRRRYCGIRRSPPFRSLVERVGLKPAVDGIQSIVDGKVHHRVHTRFVERVVERSDARVCGGHARVCIPGGYGVAAVGR